MAQVSPECVAGYAAAAGFSGNDLIVAVAVARQESSFRTDAANSCCVGLWQINLKAHGVTAADMKLPMRNAQMAYKIFKQAGGWCTSGSVAKDSCNPWQAYGQRDWSTALKTGQNAVASIIAKGVLSDITSGKSSTDIETTLKAKGLTCTGLAVLGESGAGGTGIDVPNPLAAADAFINAFNRMGAWMTNPDNLLRIVKVVLGGFVVLVGGAALMDKQVMNITPAGRIIKAVGK